MGLVGQGKVGDGWVGLSAAADEPDKEQEVGSRSPIHASKDRWGRGLRATPEAEVRWWEIPNRPASTLVEAGLWDCR